jgi:lipopolysaccharide export LptBFGC system permease protein LptF
VNQQERESIQQSELTARKLLYWMATRAIFVIIAVLAAVGLIRWNNRDESQINMVFKVIDMWRELSLTCFQVATGDF